MAVAAALSSPASEPILDVVLLGADGVGKTSLFDAIAAPGEPFKHSLISTLGVDFRITRTPHTP